MDEANKTNILHVHLSADLMNLLRTYAEERGIQLSAAVRVLLYEKLKKEEK